jgi:steroid 5-alpha reductase family enzyme
VSLCLAAAAVVTLAMLVAWKVQRAVGNAGWVDVFWTFSTGLALAGVALAAPGALWRHVLLAALLLIWAGRLGGYVVWRVATGPEDTRYAMMRQAAGADFQRRMLKLVIGQGPVSGILAVSVYLAAVQPALGLRVADVLGAAVLLTALAGEALADNQLRVWRADPANAGGICEAGLWALCRHPNYFFEALGWLAYPVIAFVPSRPETGLALVAPVLMFLVLRYLTGVPPLEAAMLARRGEAYRAYQARSSALLPRWRRHA